MAGKKQAPAKFEEPDETEGWEDAVVDTDGKDAAADMRLRDWRDVERYREMKELRRLVDDDYGLEEIFHLPSKSRGESMPMRAGARPEAPTTKAKAAKPAPSKLKAKAKRR